jgi:hypothetical protein
MNLTIKNNKNIDRKEKKSEVTLEKYELYECVRRAIDMGHWRELVAQAHGRWQSLHCDSLVSRGRCHSILLLAQNPMAPSLYFVVLQQLR